MCGIAGIITRRTDHREVIVRAEHAQRHRGPDAQGISTHKVCGWNIALGHQRLSIIDLSDAGNQPMFTTDQSSVIIYNGEVYNYREIRRELRALGHRFKSDSDTEVVLTALLQWGPERALNRFNGMWAFAWLDTRNRRLVISRDRAGVKPLHVFLTRNELLFASEVKTILAMAKCKFQLDHQVVGEFLHQSLLEATESTFFKDIKKHPAAHYAIIDLDAERLYMDVRRYWHIPQQPSTFSSEEDLAASLKDIFFDAVRLRLRSDVPVGVLLSGGIDSSSIATAMQSILGKDAELNLLSAVSDDKHFDESYFIDIMGRYLKKDVHKVRLDFTPERAFKYLDQVCWFNDAPVGSFSNVAQFLLMQRAKDLGITVILSGQGSDELTAGYLKFLFFYVQSLLVQGNFLKALHILWTFWRQGTVISQFKINEAKRYLPSVLRPRVFNFEGPSLMEYKQVSVGLPRSGTLQDRQKLDFDRFSIPALTHYEDRMSMAWAREIRVPFLDYRLVEMLLPLAPEWKLQKGWTKYIFRKAMEPYLPGEITWRKDKQGFVNPQNEWLKYDLKQKVMNYLCEDSLIFRYGFVDQKNIASLYEAYCRQDINGGRIGFKDIFNPLSLEIFLRKYQGCIS